MIRDKVVTADEAIALIRDGDVVSCSGFVGIGTPEELITALKKRFVNIEGPRDPTLVFAAAPGDGKEQGLNRLARGPGAACNRRPLRGLMAGFDVVVHPGTGCDPTRRAPLP